MKCAYFCLIHTYMCLFCIWDPSWLCWSIWKTLDVLSPSISLQELAAPQIRSSITGGVAKHHLLIQNLCSENKVSHLWHKTATISICLLKGAFSRKVKVSSFSKIFRLKFFHFITKQNPKKKKTMRNSELCISLINLWQSIGSLSLPWVLLSLKVLLRILRRLL